MLATLLAEARARLGKFGYCLLPVVSEKITRLLESNRLRDGDHRDILDLDMVSVINTGTAVDHSPGPDYCLTINGVDREGSPLLVMVLILPGDAPLVIADFMVPMN